ncbi:MAG TPA: hypothetical protein VD902_10845 [Symbiobacteriaceae bacterium]|nr:hypothetical protein [Symbiobacteriaceae bacterium]
MFDPDRQVLYVGLAIDLAERFRQHNGLVQADPRTCKVNEINGYFERHERLGYGILVQSPMSQPATSKNKHRFTGKRGVEVIEDTTERVKEEIRTAEGVLLEAYRRQHGGHPPWNKIGGSADGQKRATDGSYHIISKFRLEY